MTCGRRSQLKRRNKQDFDLVFYWVGDGAKDPGPGVNCYALISCQ